MTTDQRIVRGMSRQRDLRLARIDEGARQVGWKVGFGSPSALALLGIDRPLVGFLLDTGMLSAARSSRQSDRDFVVSVHEAYRRLGGI